ncbi:MAG TPA: ABC transporter ATP-binding protein [Opitutaceae bacterium]|nr:ABC transporter ATP-binding protein [Opitutaceae bacterium]
MARPIIEVQGVSKRYELGRIGMTSFRDEVQRFMGKIPAAAEAREFWALRDVNFNVEPGTVVGIIGHNGAGKSTLLKILSRITEPTTGEIHLRGRVASLLEVGTGFHPELSGRENIFLNGTILGMTRAEIGQKFDEIVAFAEVSKFIDTPVKRYSSGMYVRLAFAVAAHLEPEILIIDEVLAVGDQAFQQKCLGKMQDVATNGGRTILFVSHHMTAIRRLCKQCLVLDKGVASAVLPVEQAVDRYTQSQKISPNLVDLSDRTRHDTQGRDFRINSIDIPAPGVLRYGEPGYVDVHFTAKRSVQGFSVGLGFDTTEGQRILTLDSDTLCEPIDLAAGEHCMRVGLECWPMHPANYRVSVALIAGHNFLDTVPNAAVWEVLTSASDNVSDRGFGAVRPKPVVQLIK